jgi:hypothetical protein
MPNCLQHARHNTQLSVRRRILENTVASDGRWENKENYAENNWLAVGILRGESHTRTCFALVRPEWFWIFYDSQTGKATVRFRRPVVLCDSHCTVRIIVHKS